MMISFWVAVLAGLLAGGLEVLRLYVFWHVSRRGLLHFWALHAGLPLNMLIGFWCWAALVDQPYVPTSTPATILAFSLILLLSHTLYVAAFKYEHGQNIRELDRRAAQREEQEQREREGQEQR